MADYDQSLLQLLNPEYRPLQPSTRANVSPVTPAPFPTQQRAKPAPAKAGPANHRAGDWVCLFCNNHNYSFREVCNRCNAQTKMENLRQSLSLYQNQNIPPFGYDSVFSVEKGRPLGFSNSSRLTAEPELSATRLSGPQMPMPGLAFQLAPPRSEMKDPEAKEYAFERKLFFSFSDDAAEEPAGKDAEEEEGDATEQEKRLLRFLNFD